MHNGRRWTHEIRDVGDTKTPKWPRLLIILRYGRALAGDPLNGDAVQGWQIELRIKGRPSVCRTFPMLAYALERLGGMLDMIPMVSKTIPSLTFPSEEGVQIWLAVFSGGGIWRGYTREPIEALLKRVSHRLPGGKSVRSFHVRYDGRGAQNRQRRRG